MAKKEFSFNNAVADIEKILQNIESVIWILISFLLKLNGLPN